MSQTSPENYDRLLHQYLNNSLSIRDALLEPLPQPSSLESAFVRLNLSGNPSLQSSFLPLAPPAYDGAPMLGNQSVSNRTSTNEGLPSFSFHQMQQAAIELQQLRLQDAVLGQIAAFMRNHDRNPTLPDTLDCFSPTVFCNNPPRMKFLNRREGLGLVASQNGYGGSCCNRHSRNQSCFQRRTPSTRESTKRRPSSYANGFHLDSGAHCRTEKIDGPALEPENSNMVRALSCSRHLHHEYSSLEELRGRIMEVAKDQNGCRFLQKKFEEGSEEEIEMIFSEVKDHVSQLMVDPFGNYLVQKLIEVCNENQRTEILHVVTKEKFELVAICLNPHGTRAVQKLLEHLTTPQQISCIMLALRPGAVTLTNNMNGHHVILHCLKSFSNEDNRYLLNAVADHCVEIATDRSGCCVLQQCVEHAQGEPRERLISEITENALLLSQDPFGNYVVQYILDLHIPHLTEDILRQLEGNFVSLSLQKFSSHVVEKCLKYSEVEQSTRIIRELLSSCDFFMLPLHEYANYVIQSALSVAKGPIRNALVGSLLQMHFPSMRSNPYGKRIVQWINANK